MTQSQILWSFELAESLLDVDCCDALKMGHHVSLSLEVKKSKRPVAHEEGIRRSEQ